MSVSDIPTRKLYDCDGAAKNYPILYQYLAESDNTVKHIDSVGAITTLILDDVGANGFVITAGEVVTNTLYPNTDQIWLIRETPRTQASVRKNNRRTAASVDDGSYDKLTMIVQEIEDTQERTLALADTTPTDVSVEIPAPVARRVPIWDATGKFLEYTTYDPDTLQSGAAASAAAALASETAAGISETNCADIYDDFDDRYLGAKASDPALDNDGDALIDGAAYWNTTDKIYKLYDLGVTTWYSAAAGLEGSYNPTAAPNGSGTIALNSSGNLLLYNKIGRMILISGQIQIGVVSSPVGTRINITIPFTVSGAGEFSDRAGGVAVFYDNSTMATTLVPVTVLAGGDVMSIVIDASTVAVNDSFSFSFSYNAA